MTFSRAYERLSVSVPVVLFLVLVWCLYLWFGDVPASAAAVIPIVLVWALGLSGIMFSVSVALLLYQERFSKRLAYRILLVAIICLSNIALCAYLVITPESLLPPNFWILLLTWMVISIGGYWWSVSTHKP
jgi:hypothetical protein